MYSEASPCLIGFASCHCFLSLVLVMYLDRLCIAVAGPRIQREMGISPSHWGWVIGAFTLSYAIFEIPSGMLARPDRPAQSSDAHCPVVVGIYRADRRGDQLSNSAASVRFLFGAGEAGAFPNCTSAVSRWVPAEERARALSVFWMATAMGGALAPPIVVVDRTTPRMAGGFLRLRFARAFSGA